MTRREISLYRKKWNVPDWRVPGDYPKFEDLELNLWRWEFVRRRSDYRKDWEVWSVKTYKQSLEYRDYLASTNDALFAHYKDGVLKPNHSQFRAKMLGPPKYGLFGLPNPAIRHPWRLSFEKSYGQMIFGKGGELLSGSEVESPIFISEGRAVVFFDLTRPLPKQIKLMTKELKEWQQYKYPNVKQRRAVSKRKSSVRGSDGALWPLYLRLIDARNENVSFDEIGECLLDLDTTEAYDQGKPRAQQLHRAACQVSLNFPD